MTKGQECEIKQLKDAIKLYNAIKVEALAAYDKDYRTVPQELIPREIEKKIMFKQAILSVYEYYVEKVGDLEYIKFGKYIYFALDTLGETLRFNLYLGDDETETKLYDTIFGSHSGINEFFQDHFPDIFSVICGNTNYSHAFGSHDLKDALSFFKRFGYENYEHKTLYWHQAEYINIINKAKDIIDWFIKVSNDAELMADIDKLLDTYFEIVFKHNSDTY